MGRHRAAHPHLTGIVGHFPVSCTEAKGARQKEFAAFRAAFEDRLVNAVRSQPMLTDAQMRVIGALRERTRVKEFLPRDEFVALCRQHGIGGGRKGLDENQLLDILDTLGVVMHFKDLRALDALLLSPEWLTKGVYAILYSDTANRLQGRLRFADILVAVNEKPVLDQTGRPLTFDRQRTQFTVDAMRRFKLCWRLPEDEDQIIIPALLATDEPREHGFDSAKAWSFRFLFEGLMPQHVLPSLLVDRHGDVGCAGTPPRDLVWRLGVVLRPPPGSYDASAFVEVVENNRTLTISVQGRHGDDYLGVLRESVRRSLAKMPHLVVHEQVALAPQMLLEDERATLAGATRETEWAPFHQVQETLKAGQAVYIGPLGRRYSLQLINPRLPAAGGSVRVLAQVDEAVGAKPRVPEAPLPTPIPTQPRHVRIFLSSPGDVAEERALARELVKSALPVNEWLRGRLTFDLVSWDDPDSAIPMPAHLTPQEAINRGLKRPSECDVVIVLLWSRMGTPLPAEYVKPNGTPYRSGTEWEFEDALAQACRTDGKPIVLLYRRTQKPQIEIDDPDLEAKREQYRRVGQFFESLRGTDGSIRCGVDSYETPEQFRLKLDQHVQHIAKRLLDEAGPVAVTGLDGVLAKARETFRGFDGKSFVEKDRDLATLRQLMRALDKQAIEAASDEVKVLLQTLSGIVA
jgi:hypothetical protein